MRYTLGDTILIWNSEGEEKTYIEFYDLVGTKAKIISLKKDDKAFVESLVTGLRFWISLTCIKFETKKIQIDLGDMYTTYIHVPDEIYERFISEKPKITMKAV